MTNRRSLRRKCAEGSQVEQAKSVYYESSGEDSMHDFEEPSTVTKEVRAARSRRSSSQPSSAGRTRSLRVLDYQVEEFEKIDQSFDSDEFEGDEIEETISDISSLSDTNHEIKHSNNSSQDLESTDLIPPTIVNHSSEHEERQESPLASSPVEVVEEKPKKRKRQAKPKPPKKTPYEWHPELVTVWDELDELEEDFCVSKADQPQDVTIKLLPFQLEGLNWMQTQENSRFNGGILADEMGMGKTIQMISLLVTQRVTPNLILCPTVAILQWYAELNERTKENTLKVLVFHGINRTTSVDELVSYDVVLSTYAIVESGFRKQTYGFQRKGNLVKEKSILHKVQWARVVLDEAHAIKDRSCSTARAVFALKTERRWSLSGTPLQNRVGELYSLIRFMDADPFSYYFCKKCPCKMNTWSFSDRMHCDQCGHTSHSHFCWWNAEILKPIQKYGSNGDGLIAFRKLSKLLDRIMLRRTKIERADDLGLPPRVVRVRRDVFNEAEEEFYESLYGETSRQFNTYIEQNTVLNNYASIFSLLSRMRLAVNHPDLVAIKMNASEKPSNLVCGLCHELAEDAIAAKCKHVFCREDVRQYIETAPEGQEPLCPTCFKPLTIDLTQPEVEAPLKSKSSAFIKDSIVTKIDFGKWRSSTKIEALVEELTRLQKEGSTEKSIVFSQFVAFLDLIQWRLSRAGFSVVKLDGRMSPQQRDTVIQTFMTDSAVTVFLVSLKAGGVALNLTEASRVFIMDPWWNPAVEDQAFDRIHRLGQHRPIKITRFALHLKGILITRMIIENSIESRILQLQEKKKALFQSTVGKDISALTRVRYVVHCNT